MRKNCPSCGKFTFEFFQEELDDKGNILLQEYGHVIIVGFIMIK